MAAACSGSACLERVVSRVVMALRVNECFHTLEGRRGCPNILDYMP